MSREERFQGSLMMRLGSSSGGSPGSARLYGLGGSQRRQHLQQQRSGREAKKPPEPLRRAVADCLSSSAPHPHGNASVAYPEAARTLRDYMAAPATTDMAYSVLLEHTLAERDRSPAVVSRCVALLKCYLLRYMPTPQVLRQIEVFCANSIAECYSVSNRKASPLSSSAGHHSTRAMTSGNVAPPSVPASNYASPSLVKSLIYVRSLVARHLSKVSYQPVAFPGASATLRQTLPTLSSFLSRSFNSQLSPEVVNSQEPSETKDVPSPSVLNLSSGERVDSVENTKYISADPFKWRWQRDNEQQQSSLMTESVGVTRPYAMRSHGFLEVGAASLLVVDLKTRMKDRSWKLSIAGELPEIDQLLQPSTVTTATSFDSAHNHLKAITASKRLKPGQYQVWVNIPASTFHPRARTLFQYRHYSEQQPLQLNPSEVSEVIAAVCLEPSPANSNYTTTMQLSNPNGKPTTDVAVSVLIKLVIDMYMMDRGTASPLTLFMLEEMLSSSKVASRVRVFDIILNLGVHAHLLEPMLSEDSSNLGDESSPELCLNSETAGRKNTESNDWQSSSLAIDSFESWLLAILYEILLLLVQKEESEEIVWASALSCLFYFLCDKGRIWRKRLEGLDIRVIKAFLDVSREHSWAEIVHCKLICILANMFYRVPDESANAILETPLFLAEQVDRLGGIDFICLEYARSNLKDEKQNLFLVLFDYILDRINENSVANGGFTFGSDEIQPLAAMLTLADAPEAFYIAVKHGVEGIGEILKRSVSSALSRYSNYERINLLLEKVTKKLDTTISSFTRLDNEFLYMIRITKSYKSLNSIDDGNDIGMKIRLSWTTLHSLLHSERSAYRHNGYVWLVELLLSGIIEGGNANMCSNIRSLQQQIALAGSRDLACLSVPLPVSIFCGLLKSKYNFVRWGFLFVLEKLLIRCKLLLDENKLQQNNSGKAVISGMNDGRLEQANALVDLMSCGLALLVQITETDRTNILKICDVLFSQLSLKVLPADGVPLVDNFFGFTSDNSNVDVDQLVSKHNKDGSQDEFLGGISIILNPNCPPYIYESGSKAALLLRGSATVPMQLVARVPTSVLYWPLIQLAGAATDDITLGVAVGSQGGGNLPGASSDIRAALLLLLIGKCTADSAAFQQVGGKFFFRELLDDTDSRVAYYSSAFLLKKMMTEEPEKYQRLLQSLIFKAQQSNNEKLLENPYLQMRGILQLLSDLGAQL